jgi:hypothetical protein
MGDVNMLFGVAVLPRAGYDVLSKGRCGSIDR